MKKIVRNFALLAAVGIALTACGDDDDSSTDPTSPTTPPVTPTVAFKDKFGTSLAAAYDAPANTEARNPTTSDVPALNLQAEPLDNN